MIVRIVINNKGGTMFQLLTKRYVKSIVFLIVTFVHFSFFCML